MARGLDLLWAPIDAIGGLLTALFRRPRLRVELSLRGTTRTGTVYAVVSNRGSRAAHAVRVRFEWQRGDERSTSEEVVIEEIEAGDAVRVEFPRPHTLLPSDDEDWSVLAVSVRAERAFTARARLDLVARRGGSSRPAPPVQYATGALPCPAVASGKHDFEDRPYENDGVIERWRVCRQCRHVEREPLTAEEKEIQAGRRAARAARERAQMEREFARRAAEAGENARQASRDEPPRGAERRSRPPTREADLFPAEIAFYVLGLDGATATWEDVSAAHRRLALAHHPDRVASEDPTDRAVHDERMAEINRARDRLRVHFGRRASAE